MSEIFFQSPILNSPYDKPNQHWELDGNGQPTSVIVPRRRQSALVSPIPKARKFRGKALQADLLADDEDQEYNPMRYDAAIGLEWLSLCCGRLHNAA